MTLLVIENYPKAGLAALGRTASGLGHEWKTVRAYQGEELPSDISAFSGLITLGGGQNALADDEYPHLAGVCELIRTFHEADRPVLGICLGCQLIARAFGLQPDHIHAEQQILQLLTGVVLGIDNRESEDVAHDDRSRSRVRAKRMLGDVYYSFSLNNVISEWSN